MTTTVVLSASVGFVVGIVVTLCWVGVWAVRHGVGVVDLWHG